MELIEAIVEGVCALVEACVAGGVKLAVGVLMLIAVIALIAFISVGG